MRFNLPSEPIAMTLRAIVRAIDPDRKLPRNELRIRAFIVHPKICAFIADVVNGQPDWTTDSFRERLDATIRGMHSLESFGRVVRAHPKTENGRVSKNIRAVTEWYDQYLRTDHWQEVRRRTWELFQGICVTCPSTKDLECHHKAGYDCLGHERVPDHVILVCPDCHDILHYHQCWLSLPSKAPKSVIDILKRERKGWRTA